MPTDRFVYWTKGKVPALADVRTLLEDYLGDVGHIQYTHESPRMFAVLKGQTSFPLRRLNPAHPRMAIVEWASGDGKDPDFHTRYIEVFIGDDHIDVMTRMADALTEAVAGGFVELLKDTWQGSDSDNEACERDMNAED